MLNLKALHDAIFGPGQEEDNERLSAKKRLSVVLINDRADRDTPDFMPQLRQEIIAVLKKYVPIYSEDAVEVHMSNRGSTSIMEMSVSLEQPEA
ncbi:MAG: cell division topological specificity factor MinE [Succinivibrio sp.]|nr:cell division topological specificity factor MinE [Succinivibrio sp.]